MVDAYSFFAKMTGSTWVDWKLSEDYEIGMPKVG